MMHFFLSLPRTILCIALLTSSIAGAQNPGSDGETKDGPPAEASALQALDAADENQLDVDEDQPWREGVSPEAQDKARSLFREANALVRESVFVTATDKYEKALEIWDHPAIHYNLALALLNLDQPLRLRVQLLAALKYDGAALGNEKKLRAEQYLKLVEKQLTTLEVTCAHQGAIIEIDGKFAFKGPGKYKEFLRPGPHTVRTTAPGYEADERSLSLLPDQSESLKVKLYTVADMTEYRRRWPIWGPLTLTIAGAAVLAGGGTVFWLGGKKIRDADDLADEDCAPICEDSDEYLSSKSTGDTMQAVGIASMAVGGAATITGAILLYMNRKIPYRIDPEAKEKLSFSPVFNPGYSGFLAQGTF